MMTNPASLDELKRQLAELDELSRQGVLTGDAARSAREDLERRIVAAVTAQGAAAAPAPAAEPAPRVPMKLSLAIAAFVLVVGAAGYAVHGDWQGWKVGPPDPALREQAAAAQDGQPSQQQIEGLVGALEERLKSTPDDVQAWQMLGRTYAALGRADEALKAFRKVGELKPGDAQALADLADAIGMVNNRSLDGEPEKLIAQALKADPNNVKALALGGTIAFNREQYPKAVDLWERAIRNAGPAGEFAQQLQGAVDEARKRGGMPPAVPVAQAAPPAPAVPASAGAVAAAGATITGRVELAPALRERIAPGDTVFVFARPADGSRMPLAIVKRTAGELPFEFTLDDSQAMTQEMRLSTQKNVIVGVRVSKTGDAMPKAGDLQGTSQPVAVGSKGVRLVIDETVK
ncbi:cytochrome c-type biogenesis protein CcmH [Rubrivivax gelatinosus]|uniref:c-type cytochrome biogenesis protein CcmI n=2 Tax=Rubrivivax gelatinosus TaxID=28068 RepID=UPI0018CB2380|nr:c-type cytochrome biogenesis protein CcmI [Rubrivivax gelatinosus]MBG6082087.1 cytochrome c-type biogenesis protein CcmH [Rubrivivax gelatinosus]